MGEFKSEFLVFHSKMESEKFRIIENPTNEWIDVKIYELTLVNQQVSIKSIAKDDDMLLGGEGRSFYSRTRLWLQDWQLICNVDVFKECLVCESKDCAKSCRNIHAIINSI